MKILLVSIILLAVTGCTGEQFYFGDAEHERPQRITHYQECYFPFDMVIERGGNEITAVAGDTISVPHANLKYMIMSEGIWSGTFASITMGEDSATVINTLVDPADGHYTSDTIMINIYHADICTVGVD